MARVLPTAHDSPQPQDYACIVCGAVVGSEPHAIVPDRNTVLPAGRTHVVHDGQPWEIWFTPTSRYWCAAGILCGAACSLSRSGI